MARRHIKVGDGVVAGATTREGSSARRAAAGNVDRAPWEIAEVELRWKLLQVQHRGREQRGLALLGALGACAAVVGAATSHGDLATIPSGVALALLAALGWWVVRRLQQNDQRLVRQARVLYEHLERLKRGGA